MNRLYRGGNARLPSRGQGAGRRLKRKRDEKGGQGRRRIRRENQTKLNPVLRCNFTALMRTSTCRIIHVATFAELFRTLPVVAMRVGEIVLFERVR